MRSITISSSNGFSIFQSFWFLVVPRSSISLPKWENGFVEFVKMNMNGLRT
ncbi:hypothetical protein RchiOBHm_Chr4g0423311 [Rosa chinensis]|uniref:Uncharacterized protein n=1 Tax=Rosa chinensis TaxID=74649 RepID=A0A2P6QYK7_ROSCH|nr:hypothetical protein RchiOBHm_Chr4g0423311 [Rosa chinensis]